MHVFAPFAHKGPTPGPLCTARQPRDGELIHDRTDGAPGIAGKIACKQRALAGI